MEAMTLREIGRAVGATILDETEITAISTDSREIPPGCLFVAIVGENFDGHDFVTAALEKGAAMAVVSRDGDFPKDKIILVKDTLKALLDISGQYRTKFSAKIVGVTGSVGKTSTKEMIWTVLNAGFSTLKTQGNQNNEIGTPKTLLSLTSDHEAAVIEMGMTGLGEIEDLTTRVRPDIGVITNIGVSHIGRLGSRENILKAKLEITMGMAEGSPLLICSDNDLLGKVNLPSMQVIRYGVEDEGCHVRGINLYEQDDWTHFTIRDGETEVKAKIPTIGKHNVYNALAAYKIGILMGMQPHVIVEALTRYAPSGMRQKVVHHSGFTVIEDCYNASPDSLRAAADAFQGMNCKGRKIMVLSDVLELGEDSQKMHEAVGSYVAEKNFDYLLAWGKDARYYIEAATQNGMENALFYEQKEDLTKALVALLKPHDAVWFKGSRGMALEEVIDRIYKEC